MVSDVDGGCALAAERCPLSQRLRESLLDGVVRDRLIAQDRSRHPQKLGVANSIEILNLCGELVITRHYLNDGPQDVLCLVTRQSRLRQHPLARPG